MLTAHLPSGYVLARSLPPVRGGLSAALAGAVFPDVDMIWFHLVDDRAFHHHLYWVHIPLFWAGAAAVSLPLLWRTVWRGAAVVFLAAVLLHLLLDTIGGGIMWAAPFSTQLLALVQVPATQSHWVLSFVLHWTFLLELAIWLTAGAIYLRRGRT